MLLLAVLLLAPASVRAYSSPDAYSEQPSAGGGGGHWFTGSPADGHGCSVCHSAEPGEREYPLYVAGLPLDGYELGTIQEVVLSWPEFEASWRALRPDATVAASPDQATPAVGLVAEFVAESGKGAGSIEIDAANAGPREQCELTRPNLKPRLGVKLYQVRAGLEPVQIKPDSTGMMRCEARQLGQRCIVALTSCGAHEVRVRWSTPDSWQGPIWFSAGLVATEVISGSFDHDSVDEITVPLLEATASEDKHQRVLRSGCTLVPGARAPRTREPWLATLACASWLLDRRRRRRGRAR